MEKRIGILYPREEKIVNETISVNWLSRLFKFSTIVPLDRVKKYDFDKILVSVHFENNYPYLLQMIEDLGLEIEREKRKTKIYLGGPVAINPYPLYNFIDAFFVGDFDSETVKHAVEDEEFLKKDRSLFIPEEKEEVRISRRRDPIYYHFFEDRLYVEIQSGCRNNCRFCMIGWTKMLSFNSVSHFENLVKKSKSAYLIGSDIFSHPHITEIINIMRSLDIDISFPSSRLEEIENNLDVIRDMKLKSFTIAPESSERIRKALGKNYSNEEVLNYASLLKDVGVKNLKLYFMIGLPGEREEDLEDIASLVKNLKKLFRVSVTVSVFVPKSHTPFQFAPFDDIKSLEKKNKTMKKLLKGVKVHLTNPKKAYIQMILSIGNKEISNLLKNVYRYGLNYSVWRKTAEKLGIDLKKYEMEKDVDFAFDFDSIKFEISKKTLYKVYEKYKKDLDL